MSISNFCHIYRPENIDRNSPVVSSELIFMRVLRDQKNVGLRNSEDRTKLNLLTHSVRDMQTSGVSCQKWKPWQLYLTYQISFGYCLVLSSYSFLLLAALFALKRRKKFGWFCIKENGAGENCTNCVLSSLMAEGSGWLASHLFQWHWSAASPKRVCTAPAHH